MACPAGSCCLFSFLPIPHPCPCPCWTDPAPCSLSSFGSCGENEAWDGNSSVVTQFQHRPCAKARACTQGWLPAHGCPASSEMPTGGRDIPVGLEDETRTHRRYAPFGTQRPGGTPGHLKGHQTPVGWLEMGKETQPRAPAPWVLLCPSPSLSDCERQLPRAIARTNAHRCPPNTFPLQLALSCCPSACSGY